MAVQPPVDRDALEILVAITEPASPAENPTSELSRLLRAIVEALNGRAAVLQTADGRGGRFTVVDAVNLPDAVGDIDGEPLDDGDGWMPDDGEEIVLGEAPAEAVPEAFRAAGLVHAMALPVRVRERALGVVWVAGDEPLAADPLRRHAARAGAERIGRALEQTHLYETLERAMAQLLESDERMLGRIGLDIHDGPTQQLSVALLEVQLLEAELQDAEAAGAALPERLRPSLARIYETLGGALYEMRELIGHLRPAQFEGRRLPELLGDATGAFEASTGATAELRALGEFPDERVSLSQKITFYRILQEALTNAHRHGRAERVTVRLREGGAGITMEVRDDGTGFEPMAAMHAPAGRPKARFGLLGMRDRAQLLGGTFEVWSQPGQGTLVTVFLPRWSRSDRGTISGA